MKILGLSSNYHDSSAALVVDGEVVASSAEERFTREKHDPSFPHFSINFCLEHAGITADQIDLVAYHEDPIAKFSRNLSATMMNWPHSAKTFIHAMKETVTAGFWIRHEIAKKLDLHPRQVVYIPHHLSHAGHTFLTSPFESAAILTLDAVGEWTSSGIFFGDKAKSKKCITPLELVPFPNSLGLVYSAFTGFLGFKVNSGESSTMALAAFGKPNYLNEVRKIINLQSDGTFQIDLSYFDFSQVDSLPITEKFISVFGPPRHFKNKLPFDCLNKESMDKATEDDRRFADIAASIQYVLEETVVHMAKRARQMTGSDYLCLAGGVALNCVANSKIIKESGFKNVYCPPDPGDGGGAMGAALYLAREKGESIVQKKFTTYLGEKHASDDLYQMLQHLDPSVWHRYSKLPLKPLTKDDLRITRYTDQRELLKRTAALIADKKIVGWAQGRFENGPRALGARSILIDPSDAALAKRLSTAVKLRAPFRPYACSFTEEAAKLALEYPNNQEPLLAKWMLCALPVRPDAAPLVQAAVHVDNTTRAQIVRREDHELFYDLLVEFGKIKGLSAILNTSFNESGYPIVNTPTEALMSFARTFMDVLVVGDVIIERTKNASA